MASVLFVCTGNICRSPMAEGLLRQILWDRDIDDVDVRSAGVSGLEGWSASPEAVGAMADMGVDISGHLARRLDRRSIEGADLIVGMAAEHREAVGWLVPEAAERTFTLAELVRLIQRWDEEPAGSADERASAAVAGAGRLRVAGAEQDPGDEDVPDPMGLGRGAYRAVALQLESLVKRLADGVFGPVAGDERSGGSVPAGRGHEGDGFG